MKEHSWAPTASEEITSSTFLKWLQITPCLVGGLRERPQMHTNVTLAITNRLLLWKRKDCDHVKMPKGRWNNTLILPRYCRILKSTFYMHPSEIRKGHGADVSQQLLIFFFFVYCINKFSNKRKNSTKSSALRVTNGPLLWGSYSLW